MTSKLESWRRAAYNAEECLAGCLASPEIAKHLDQGTARTILERLSQARLEMLAASEATQPAAGEPVAWECYEPASEWNGYKGREYLSREKPKGCAVRAVPLGRIAAPPAAAPVAAGEAVDGVEGFACWLIDHCEGYEIFEEKIQDWVADYLKSDAYQRISAPPAAAHGDEAVLWELLEELRTATDRQALPGAFIRVMWEAGCDWINARAAMRAQGDGGEA